MLPSLRILMLGISEPSTNDRPFTKYQFLK
jgi:hypothetical protein